MAEQIKLTFSSNSEESIISNKSSNSNTNNNEISVLAEFDEIIRNLKNVRKNRDIALEALLHLSEDTKQLLIKNRELITENNHLKELAETNNQNYTDLELKLMKARKLFDNERKLARKMKKERDEAFQEIQRVYAKFNNDNHYFEDNQIKRSKLSTMNGDFFNKEWNPNSGPTELSAIKEINSTGSILSDFSYSKSEDDLDDSNLRSESQWRPNKTQYKDRRSSTHKIIEINQTDTVKATTTLTMSKNGPIKATSIIESVPSGGPLNQAMKRSTPPQPSTPSMPSGGTTTTSSTSSINEPVMGTIKPLNDLIFKSWNLQSPVKHCRQHSFQQKNIFKPGDCNVCEKRIRFGKSAMKCKDCRAICHIDCKDLLPLPCIPTANTPLQRNALGVIGDYTPSIPPMVPALLVHCINEIELRGLSELGIYRISAAETEVKALKEKFLRGKGIPNLNQIDIHVLCSTVKDFLRSLSEPICTYELWKNFVKATEVSKENIEKELYNVISQLPQPNRDTLAYMIIHLQKIAEIKECKMPIDNLAKIFAPTIVGYSSEDPDPNSLLTEIRQSTTVMTYFMLISNNYWTNFIDVDNYQTNNKLQQTPSTDSLLRPMSNNLFFTPNSRCHSALKRKKFFSTPPL